MLVSVMVPLTRGSTTTLWPDKVASVLATASMSALLKFSVTGSREGLAAVFFLSDFLSGSGLGVCACAECIKPSRLAPKLKYKLRCKLKRKPCVKRQRGSGLSKCNV